MTDLAVRTQQLQTMLALQDKMNRKVNERWIEQHFAWYRAVWVECAEMLDHFGWKWWKHQKPDVAQVKLELVDIFHFGLSIRLMEGESAAVIAQVMAKEISNQLEEPASSSEFREALEQVAATALTKKAFDSVAFAQCMRAIEMDFEELFRQYVGKNVLNLFRQDHGYKDGSYRKLWQGREDNEHLVEVLQQLDTTAADFSNRLYESLLARYQANS